MRDAACLHFFSTSLRHKVLQEEFLSDKDKKTLDIFTQYTQTFVSLAVQQVVAVKSKI